MQNPLYVAQPDFLSTHEWVYSGTAHTVANTVDVHSIDGTKASASAKIIMVSRVMANPRLLKLRDLGNFNDRFMKMYNAKWVIHLSKPMETLFERDWDTGMNNLMVLEERITVERSDVALERYIPKVETRYQSDMKELSPWWKLNVLKIKNAKGDVLPPDSFSAVISRLRHDEAMEAYEAYMTRLAVNGSTSVASGSSSKDKRKDTDDGMANTLMSGSEDNIYLDGDGDKSTEGTKEDHEEANPRKCKGRGSGGDHSAKKGKTTAFSCPSVLLFYPSLPIIMVRIESVKLMFRWICQVNDKIIQCLALGFVCKKDGFCV
ncbi:hypothetical protein F5146DRAFT_994605 [Armillaria mellea]|nr:hypothetical protein F5146DRAFT_994605 [Armillaria mellea]